MCSVDAAGRVGLQAVWRPQAEDPERYRASFPALDLAALGRVSYEVPRGFGDRGESGLRAAVREAEEETRGRVSEVAELFLGAFLDGRAAGDAILETRRALARRNNPLGLAYTLYGSVDLTLGPRGDPG